jgi:hypothetical protein
MLQVILYKGPETLSVANDLGVRIWRYACAIQMGGLRDLAAWFHPNERQGKPVRYVNGGVGGNS